MSKANEQKKPEAPTKKIATSIRTLHEMQQAEFKNDPAAPRDVKRGNAYSVTPSKIVVFVERNIRPINRETVEEYKQGMRNKDIFPAVHVHIEKGQIVLKHGYHRTLAAQELEAEGEEVSLDVIEVIGNSVDTIFLMLNSQNSLAIDPVSRADAYLLLVNQKVSPAEIARRLPNPKTATHVSQQLLLAVAENPIKELVREGKVSPQTVIEAVRDEKAGGRNHVEVIEEMIKNAEAAGRAKATPRFRESQGPAKPALKLKMKEVQTSLSSLVSISGTLRNALSTNSITAEDAAELHDGVMVSVPMPAKKVLELLALLDKQSAVEEEATSKENEGADKEQTDMFDKTPA